MKAIVSSSSVSNTKTLLLGALVLCGAVGDAVSAHAGSADLTLAPTRIVLEKDTRYATVNIKNAGDATGRYRIEIVDAAMKDNGGVKLLENGAHDPYSAADYLSISPHSMTLTPGDYQTVRLLVKNQGAMADGEYRSALKVTMTETDIDTLTNRPKGDAVGIIIKPKLIMAIPIIIRHGEGTYHVNIDDAKFVASGGNNTHPQMQLAFSFSGTRSIIGDIKITHVDKNGKDSVLKFFPGVAIYRGVPKISINVPLEIPEGVALHDGKTTVSYLAQESEGGNVMAQKDVMP
jgi:hypothetical protein